MGVHVREQVGGERLAVGGSEESSIPRELGTNRQSSISDLTSHCIRCGFCLEACPTYVLTGQETESPRGRIYLVRSADEGKIYWEDARKHIQRCVGCRACEPACPSGVEYGKILELAREKLEEESPHRSKSWLLTGLTSPTRLRFQLTLARLWPGRRLPKAIARFLSKEAPEADLPRALLLSSWPPLMEEKCPPVKGEVYLLEGCAMRVLYPRIHEATRRLLHRIGYTVKEADAGCCGALHAHNGKLHEAQRMAKELLHAMPGNLPIIVNSAGCGSFLKEILLLRAEGGAPHATRIFDASEFLFEHGLSRTLTESDGLKTRVTYHDACHLAHGQGIRTQPRDLIKSIPNVEFVELQEADRCCGSGGIYNILQPRLARQMLDRKWGFVQETGAEIVATGNPGCHAWIDQAAKEHGGRVRVMHTLELLEAAFFRHPLRTDPASRTDPSK
jgi:glycolate oxidase iron-sulfur subunit